MNTLKAFITDELSKRITDYTSSSTYLYEHYNLEQQNIESYNGRQLLEMIQNADDACEKATNKNIRISLQDGYLTISNNGEPFTEGGFRSILYSNASPKVKQQNKIGQKGLGFRSILSWADQVVISSGGVKVAFSQRIAKEFLDDLRKKAPKLSEFIAANGNIEHPIATLRIPRLLNDAPYGSNEFDTVISIKLKKKVLDDVQKQINRTIDKETLVFLNNVESIEIDSPERKISFRKTYPNPNQVTVESIANGQIDSCTWQLTKLNGFYKRKNYELAIAWNEQLDDDRNVVFSYFSTKARFPFPALLHGTFELSSDRNQLVDDTFGHNAFLIGKLAELLVKTALQISATYPEASYLPLKLLNIDFDNIDAIFNEYKLKELLHKQIKKSELFPTVNNTYITHSENPVNYSLPIAEIIYGEDVKNLLIHTQDAEIKNFLKNIGSYIYTIPHFMSILSKRMTQLPISEYARLFYYFVNSHEAKISNDSFKVNEMSPVFISEKSNPIAWEVPIFLPPEGDIEFNLPDLGIHFLDKKFVEAYLEFCGDEDTLKKHFEYFGVKKYSFQEVVTALIKNYSDENISKVEVKELHSYLYPLYKNETGEKPKKLEINIPIITQNAKVANANEVYYGLTYGNGITGTLYSYDKSKLLASPKSFELEDSEENIKEYFLWLGIENYPRMIQIRAKEEFIDYSMRNYDYKRKKYDAYFDKYKSYYDFKRDLSYYYECFVQTIDDIENILKHNETETIIAWIYSDKNLKTYLDEDLEPDTSTITMQLYNAKHLREMKGREIKNHIKWQLSNLPWIKIEGSDKKRPPAICTTSETISTDFSPLIEKVKINYDTTIFRRNNIQSDKVDYLLLLVGVNKTISSFPVGTLYAIMNNLPEIDPEGDKARSFYRELAINYDEKNIDINNDEYDFFIHNGKVLCKQFGRYEYKEIKSVYYVENKRYGESIINQFYTLAVDKRRGSEKMHKLFGVKPLKTVKLTLSETPQTHPLNADFHQDIESFKPYVYVLRKDLDTQGRDKNRIKNTTFLLVKTLCALLEKEGENVPIYLEDYEYLHIPDKKTIYIKTPFYSNGNLETLKNDVRFCDAVAEAFSSLIDVEAPRQQIRELYSKTLRGRDEVIRTEFDDDRLEQLAEAREKLGIATNPEIRFWNNFLACFRNKHLPEGNLSKQQLKEALLILFPDAKTSITEAVENLNYESYHNDEDSAMLIINLIKQTGTTLQKLNRSLLPPLDLSGLHAYNFKKMQADNEDKFKYLLYQDFIQQRKDKKTFLKEFGYYFSLSTQTKGEIDYDAEKDLQQQLKEKFACIKLEAPNERLEAIYNQNLEQLTFQIASLGRNTNLLREFIDEDQEHDSMLYFQSEIETLISLYIQWIGNTPINTSVSEASNPKASIPVGGMRVSYTDLADLYKQLEANNQLTMQAQRVKIKITEKVTSRSSGENPQGRKQGRPRRPNEIIGFIGEWMVYRHLKETMKYKEEVKWISENARRAGINPDGNDNMGFDIRYKTNDGKSLRYVEVKVVGRENSFHISSGEVSFGEKEKNNYEIFLVRNLNEPQISIDIIRGPFMYKRMETFNDNQQFRVINDSFILKFETI